MRKPRQTKPGIVSRLVSHATASVNGQPRCSSTDAFAYDTAAVPAAKKIAADVSGQPHGFVGRRDTTSEPDRVLAAGDTTAVPVPPSTGTYLQPDGSAPNGVRGAFIEHGPSTIGAPKCAAIIRAP